MSEWPTLAFFMSDATADITGPFDDRHLLKLVDNGDETYSISVSSVNALVPNKYDEIALSYTGENLTGVVFKLATATIATLTLTYSGANLVGVVKT